jgi:tRNA dimethylallyltransferase
MIAIVGPTSSGKTSLAFKLCKQFNGEIISADSRQVYKFMDYGTGKVPIDEASAKIERHSNYWIIDGVKVHLYDVVEPNEEYSAYKFREASLNAISEIESDGKTPFIVGGTGFYIAALLFDMIEAQSVSADLELREKHKESSAEELQQLLPEGVVSKMNDSDRQNPRRLIRKIELMSAALADISPIKSTPEERKDLIIRLTAPKDYLYKRVDKWADESFERIIEETKQLMDKGYSDTLPLNGIIYRTAKACVNNEVASEEALQRIKYDLHDYIRRQETWFNKYAKDAKVFDITDDSLYSEVTKLVESYLNGTQ